MHWKTKAKIQNAISLLPSSVSYNSYYWLQRNLGALKTIDPVAKLKAGIKTWKKIQEAGFEPAEKVFLEVGTGWIPLVPVAYWLMGAKSTVTIDLNPYMKAELINESLEYMSSHNDHIENIFGPLLIRDRLEQLLSLYKSPDFSIDAFLELCQIDYIAPGDAAHTNLEEMSIDIHTSYKVFEHIPSEVLQSILKEGNRIISKNGIFVHRIDYADHFSYSDKTISAINFLQYSDKEWDRYANNRYMYMNRLRHDDFIKIFESSNQKIILNQPDIDEQAEELLRSGTLEVDEKFKNKPQDVLATTSAWIVSQRN